MGGGGLAYKSHVNWPAGFHFCGIKNFVGTFVPPMWGLEVRPPRQRAASSVYGGGQAGLQIACQLACGFAFWGGGLAYNFWWYQKLRRNFCPADVGFGGAAPTATGGLDGMRMYMHHLMRM